MVQPAYVDKCTFTLTRRNDVEIMLLSSTITEKESFRNTESKGKQFGKCMAFRLWLFTPVQVSTAVKLISRVTWAGILKACLDKHILWHFDTWRQKTKLWPQSSIPTGLWVLELSSRLHSVSRTLKYQHIISLTGLKVCLCNTQCVCVFNGSTCTALLMLGCCCKLNDVEFAGSTI